MYDLLLFGHITAVVVLSGSIMLEIVAMLRLSAARDAAAVADALTSHRIVGILAPISALVLLIFGLSMAAHGGDHAAGDPKEFSWGAGWLVTAYILFVILASSGGGINGKRLARLAELAEAAGTGPVTPEIDRLRRDPVLAFSVFLGPCAIVAFLFLMTTKPTGVPAAIATVVAMAVAIVLSRIWLSKLATTTG